MFSLTVTRLFFKTYTHLTNSPFPPTVKYKKNRPLNNCKTAPKYRSKHWGPILLTVNYQKGKN